MVTHATLGANEAAAPRRLRIADVALFYGARTGGIRTYLDAKERHAARTGAFEHHVIVPGRRERHAGGRHELPSLSLAASNGYRVPLGSGSLKATLREIQPDAVLLHDPWWASIAVTRLAHELDAAVLAFHHASCDLEAHTLPGPAALYKPPLQAWFRHAWSEADGVVSAVDPGPDSGRPAAFALRFGVDYPIPLCPATRCAPTVPKGSRLTSTRLAPARWAGRATASRSSTRPAACTASRAFTSQTPRSCRRSHAPTPTCRY